MSELVSGSALVTGGGSGIGRAIARVLAEAGAAVAVVDLHPERGEETVREINAQGGQASFIHGDVGRSADVDRAVTTAVAALGPLGILVNAAGILDGYLAADAMDPIIWERVIGINLTGTFLCCRRALAELLPAGAGRIVNIASVAGLIGGGGGSAYIASKHGVVGLTRHLGVQYAERGITVNAVCPGPIATGLRASSMEILGEAAPPMANAGVGASLDQIRAQVPAARRGTAAEVAAAVRYLASQGAAYITGHALVIDGGWTAK